MDRRDEPPPSTLEERSALRRKRMVAHRAVSFADAEAWDLEFWQRQSPADRLSALVELHREAEHIETLRSPRQPGTD